MTASQIKWAASHDWFIADLGNGMIQVNDAYTLDGVLFQETITFSGSFRELRDWASY